jgi:hypothetical protein
MRWAVLSGVALLALACGGEAPKERTAAPPVPKPLEGAGAAAPAAEPIDRDLPQIAEDKTLKVLFT